MTMADRNVSSQQKPDDRNSSVDHPDTSYVTHLRSSASRTSSRGGYDRDRRASNLDLSNSPSLRPGSATRDSGYNTDVSPAATISPATNTPRQQHFVFDNIGHSQNLELEERILSLSHIAPYAAGGSTTISPHAHGSLPPYQLHFEHRSRSTPPLRLSPDIFKICASPGKVSCPGTQTSSRPLSEASDTNRVQFDFESDNDEYSSNRRENSNISNIISQPPKKPGGQCDVYESCLGLQLPVVSHDSNDDDDDDDEVVFYKSGDVLKTWGIASEPQTPTCKSSLSLRQRRYCSADEDDDSLLGACGGHDPSDYARSLGPNQALDTRRHSFNDTSPVSRLYVRKAASGSEIEGSYCAYGSTDCRHSESSVTCNRDFQPRLFDTCDSRNNGFGDDFDPYDTDSDEDNNVSQPHLKDTRSVAILRDRSSEQPVTRARWSHISVTASLRLSSGGLLPWSTTVDRVSVSTQTPHVTSIMIQQILDTPVPLPNEARGTAAARLRRRQSEGGNPLPPAGSRPLPDIIPSGRDRAMSVPDLQTLARMQRAREVGRELRRLSDEFQFGTFLNSIHEEVDGQFPRLGVHLFSRPFTYFQAFLRHTFRRRRRPVISRRSTSVDLAGRLASMQLTEQSEDLPGD